jgi:hypothetical protein
MWTKSSVKNGDIKQHLKSTNFFCVEKYIVLLIIQEKEIKRQHLFLYQILWCSNSIVGHKNSLIGLYKTFIVKPVLRGHLWTKKNGLLIQVTSQKRFNSYEFVYDRTRKGWPFNTGDCLIEVTTLAGVTVLWNKKSV